MQPAIQLKQRLTDGQLTVGLLLTDDLRPNAVELARRGGLDYLIVDREHLQHDPALAAQVCASGRLLNFPVLVRIDAANFDAARIAMDLGPCGLVVPAVDRVEDLESVQQGVYLPPRGKRRPGGPSNAWVSTYSYDSFRQVVEDHVIVIPQIETLEGLANVTGIAQHPLTTALGVGPFDLSAQLGACWFGIDHPRMAEALTQIRRAAQEAGKATWMVGDGPLLVREQYRFICFGEWNHFLVRSLRQATDGMRQESEG